MGSQRRPRQARAQATVDAILTATHRIIEAEGPEKLNTNRVAKVAGVSIGSLYQYFPNKAALLAALFERHTHNLLAGIVPLLIEYKDAPIEIVTREAVREMLVAYRVNPRLHVEIMLRTTQDEALQQTLDAEADLHQALVTFMTYRAPDVRPLDPDIAAWVVSRIVQALCRAAVSERPELLDDDTLLDEITLLILGYVQKQ